MRARGLAYRRQVVRSPRVVAPCVYRGQRESVFMSAARTGALPARRGNLL